MPLGRRLRFVPVVLVLLIVLLTAARAFGAASTAAEESGATPTAQLEPAESVDTGLLAGATWTLLLPLVLMAKLKISQYRRAAWLAALPRLESHEIADYLEDYRLDPDAQYRR